MDMAKRITNIKLYGFIIISFTLLSYLGCASKPILVPVQSTEEMIIEDNSVRLAKEGLKVSARAKYKNSFVVLGLSIENNSEDEMVISKEDITVVDGKGVVKKILDTDQIENLYDDNFYIFFFPTPFPYDDPFYPSIAHYHYDHYLGFCVDRKFFLTELYKNMFPFGKLLPGTKLEGELYLQNGDLETPLKMDIDINGKKFVFTFDKVAKD